MRGMLGYSTYGGMGNLIIVMIMIILIVILIVFLLSKTNFIGMNSGERLVKIEKDLEETKKAVEEIKNKLNEI